MLMDFTRRAAMQVKGEHVEDVVAVRAELP
jgi:hypothetical protein